ncbi:MAG: two-component sensor histidine kinase [Crocinitomicaceae bacterium]|jgi:two-component sensor histidine kinase
MILNRNVFFGSMKFTLLLLTFFINAHAFSQLSQVKQRAIDSLYPIASNPEVTVKVRLECYNKCCWASAYQDYDLCLKISTEYKKLATKDHNVERQIRALHFQGHSFMMLGSLDSAETSFGNALKMAREHGLFNREAEAFGDLGNLMMKKGDVNRALKFHQRCDSVANKFDIKVERARAKINIGEILESNGNYKESLSAFKEALRISEKFKFVGYKSSIHEKLGEVHFTIGENDLAGRHYRLAHFYAIKHPNIGRQVSSLRKLGDLHYSMNSADSAMYFYQNALSLSRGNKILSDEASILAGIAVVHKVQGDLVSARSVIDESLALFQTQELNEEKIQALSNAGEIYYVTGSLSLALKSLIECYEAANNIKHLLLQEKSSELLAKIYDELGDFKNASQFYKKSLIYKEKRRNQDDFKEIIRFNIQSEYREQVIADSLKQLSEINILNVKHAQFKERERSKRRLIYLGIGVLVLILGFALYSLIIRRKRAKELNQKNKIIMGALHDKEILLKEVHHRVKNNMQVVSSLLMLKSNSTENASAKEALLDSQKRIDSMQLAHQKMYKNNNFEEIEIIEYFNDIFSMLLSPIKREEDEFIIEGKEKLLLSVEKAQALGFVIHELVMNSIKYAWPNTEAKSIRLRFEDSNDSIDFCYSDNGIGLPEDLDLTKIKSFGLKMMNSLITHQLFGTIEIVKSKGASIKIKFNK